MVCNFDTSRIARAGEVDLTSLPPEHVAAFFDTATREEDWLLHGSPECYVYLQPQRAYDLRREEGCRTAIYATQSTPIALYRAILNKRLARCIYSFCSSFNDDPAGQHFAPQVTRSVSPNGRTGRFAFAEPMYTAMMDGDTDLTKDGFVYAVSRGGFVQEEESYGDWQSYDPIDPLAIYRVSRNVSRLLFQPPGVHPRFEACVFTPEESAEHQKILQVSQRFG